jgi:hypothetical protein
MHIEGCPPPGSFGCFPVLDPNEKAVWGGRRLKVGQVRVFDLDQTTDHVTAPDQYQLVGLMVGGDLLRREVSVLGGFDAEERLLGKEAIRTSPAWCRALWSHLVGLLDLARTRHALRAPWGQLLERDCFRGFAELLARPDDGRVACRPSQRARVVRRAEEYLYLLHRQVRPLEVRGVGEQGRGEIGGRMVRNRAGKGVETADAGSLHSRPRVSTAGAADPLPIVRLPEQDTLRNVS